MRTLHRQVFLIAAALLLGSSLLVRAVAAPGSTPTVLAPPSGQQGFPFMATTENLSAQGYMEQEFFISGSAQAYTSATSDPLQPNGRWAAIPNAGVSAPYVTRMLVRRPVDPARFNGTVIVEWFNESDGSDVPSDWFYMHEEITREGYAYVGVTSQWYGVQALLGWETGPGARYAGLSHPGDSFAYDIYAQDGWALTHARAGDPRPLGPLTSHVRTVLATGFSQSAWWLATYVNAIHPVAPVYGGFLIHDGGVDQPLSWPYASLGGDPAPAGVPATPEIDTPYPFQIRTDLSVPTLIVASEFGLSDFGNGAGRSFHLEPDSARVRVWEFAGATHLESGWLEELVADASKSMPGFALGPCTGPPAIPSLIHGQAARAALNALHDWATGGEAPRVAPRLSLFVPSPPDDFDLLVAFDRDATTNLAIGGIRLPSVVAPIATLNGNRSDLDPSALGPGPQCYFVGAYDPWNDDADSWDGLPGFDPSPFPEPALTVLYPTHFNYVERVGSAALKAASGGYLRPADAAKIVLDATRAQVP